jgi:hypothetical protein
VNKKLTIIPALAVVAATVAGCSSSSTPPNNQQTQQQISENYAQKLGGAVPYPLAQMNDSLERSNLRERLLRYNQPTKISYVYVLSYDGKVISYYTIKGKVSSTQSQLTNTQNIEACPSGGNGNCGVVVDSMGDDGSYGPEEGGQNGIFFFTTDGVLVETAMPFVESDAPEKINPDRTLSYVDGSKPSSTSKG